MPNRSLAKFMMSAGVISSVAGLVVLFAFPLGSFARGGWPLMYALGWDSALSLLFFLQHSGMVRRSFRAALRIPEHYQGAIYATASGITLAAVALLWQPSEGPLFVLAGSLRVAAHACTILALAFMAWGGFVLQNFDLFGVAALKAHLHGIKPRPVPFVVRGPYRWVRHPLYFAILVIIWVNPDVTADRLLFNILWTIWICIGAHLEERDLSRDFGETYECYRQKVPMLIPWKGQLQRMIEADSTAGPPPSLRTGGE